MHKKAGVRFDKDLHIEFDYNSDSDSVVVYKNGEILEDGSVTPEELAVILENYVLKTELIPATTTTDGLMSSSDKDKLDGIASGAEVNVQSDWDEADSSSDAYIKNKPTIPTNVSQLTNDAHYIDKIGSYLASYIVQFECASDYMLLRVTKGSNFTSLVFYDTGKVEIQRFAGGDWKPTTVLRNAD